MDLLKGHEILLGTYEAFILGYKVHEEASGDPELRTSFANHAHSASVRSIAAGDKFLITSGADENVKIFNLRNRTEHGTLTHSDGCLNAMTFYDRRHLVTASEDNNICILKASQGWGVEKTLCKHQDGVTDLAIHPSGKLMLSIGKDSKLITWNLIKGRSAYVTNIKERADFVKWSPSGSHYVLGFFKRVDVYSMDNASVQFSIKMESRANDLVFIDDTTLAVAGNGNKVELWSTVTSEPVTNYAAYDDGHRVRCLALIGSEKSSKSALITASNTGIVKVWSLVQKGKDFKVKEEGSVETKCRPTCMIAHKVPEISRPSGKPQLQVAAKRSIVFEKAEPEELAVKKPRSRLVIEDEAANAKVDNPKATKKKKRKVKAQI